MRSISSVRKPPLEHKHKVSKSAEIALKRKRIFNLKLKEICDLSLLNHFIWKVTRPPKVELSNCWKSKISLLDAICISFGALCSSRMLHDCNCVKFLTLHLRPCLHLHYELALKLHGITVRKVERWGAAYWCNKVQQPKKLSGEHDFWKLMQKLRSLFSFCNKSGGGVSGDLVMHCLI